MQAALLIDLSWKTDAPKFAILFGAAAALLIAAKWASRLGTSDTQFPASEAPPLDAPVPARPLIEPEQVPAHLPYDPRLEPVSIKKFFFPESDAIIGPPNPANFCDELFVEFCDPDTNWRWTSSYLVATPDGLATVLREKNWKYLRTGHVIILSRYELKSIVEAVVDYEVEYRTREPIDDPAREEPDRA